MEAANKSAKRTPKEKLVSTAPKAKKAAPAMIIKRKAPIKARTPAKVIVPKVVTPLIEVVASGVVVAKTTSRTINLPQRFR